jgi:hypothetical protein
MNNDTITPSSLNMNNRVRNHVETEIENDVTERNWR